jgi:protein SCO1/2
MTASAKRIILILSAFLAGLVLCFSVILLVVGQGDRAIVSTASAIGGPFELVDQTGKTVTDRDLAGRPYLVFFGFTHCPDVCPTTLFEVSEVLRALGPEADRVGALFVTVDPERDTPDKMKDYLSSFDPHLRGLTGDPAAVATMLKAYRVYFRKVPQENGYTMDHYAGIYLMDKNGRFVKPFNLKSGTADAAAELRKHL